MLILSLATIQGLMMKQRELEMGLSVAPSANGHNNEDSGYWGAWLTATCIVPILHTTTGSRLLWDVSLGGRRHLVDDVVITRLTPKTYLTPQWMAALSQLVDSDECTFHVSMCGRPVCLTERNVSDGLQCLFIWIWQNCQLRLLVKHVSETSNRKYLLCVLVGTSCHFCLPVMKSKVKRTPELTTCMSQIPNHDK